MNSNFCELIDNIHVNNDVFILKFIWNGTPPKAGQFFMLRPERSCIFLPRPISIFEFIPDQNLVMFLIYKCGKGTEELYNLKRGEKVSLTGPLGNAWSDFLPSSGKAALISGSIGVAPLAALAAERKDFNFHFYAGFKNGFLNEEEKNLILGSAKNCGNIVIAAEDGVNAHNGSILDHFSLDDHYDVIFACGSTLMLKAVKKKFQSVNVRLFISTECRMACGVGACLGCTIRTVKGNARCCSEGPIFPAGVVLFDE